MKDTRIQEARGLTQVSKIVQVDMKCGWQDLDAINDNGIDGIIIDRKYGNDTGSIYYVQVKCGDGYLQTSKKRPNVIGLQLGSQYILSHRKRWQKLQGPVIIIYVEFDTGKAWWGDLKSINSYTEENNNIILIPTQQRFGEHSIGDLRKLRNHVDLDRTLDVIEISNKNLIIGSFKKTLKELARDYYKSWSNSLVDERINPRLGPIIVSRIGWRHISYRGRGNENIIQSWQLLGAAKEIIKTNDKPYQIRKPDIFEDSSKKILHDYISLRSRVIFPNRQESVVQVVLKRKQEIEFNTGKITTQIWFYSVHEPRKAKKIL